MIAILTKGYNPPPPPSRSRGIALSNKIKSYIVNLVEHTHSLISKDVYPLLGIVLKHKLKLKLSIPFLQEMSEKFSFLIKFQDVA